MTSTNDHMYPLSYSPDGLNEAAIDALIAEVADELAEQTPATSALVSGIASVRHDRRDVQRRLGNTVRVLRVHGHASAATGTEAA